MRRSVALSAFDALFPPESKIVSEPSAPHSQAASDEFEEDTRTTLWWKIELLVRSRIPNCMYLSSDAKERILCPVVYSQLESLLSRMTRKGNEVASGRGLRRDLVAFYQTVNDMYKEEVAEERRREEVAEERRKEEVAEERRNHCFGLFRFCST